MAVAGTKISGVDVLVKVGDIIVGGQSSADLSRSMSMVETSDKTNNGWITKVGGLKEWAVEMESFMVVGDAGYGALSTAFKNRAEVDVEMVFGNITFTGKALIGDFPMTAAMDDAVTFSVTLEGTGELLETILP